MASGRDYYGVTSVLDPLGIKCSAILGNGAQYCNKEGKAIMDCYLDKEMLKEILLSLLKIIHRIWFLPQMVL